MAVQPLNKTKIIKKAKKHPNRFQSDKFLRVGVSTTHIKTGLALRFSSTPQSLFQPMILTRVCAGIVENSAWYRLGCEAQVPWQSSGTKDRFEASKEDTSPARKWLQEAPDQKRKRHGIAPHEQPHVRRRNRSGHLRQKEVSQTEPNLP